MLSVNRNKRQWLGVELGGREACPVGYESMEGPVTEYFVFVENVCHDACVRAVAGLGGVRTPSMPEKEKGAPIADNALYFAIWRALKACRLASLLLVLFANQIQLSTYER